MHHRKWWARALACAWLTGGLLVGLAGSASATDVSYTGPVTPGTTLTLTCPEGERVKQSEFGPGTYRTAAAFYTNHRQHNNVLNYSYGQGATLITDVSANVIGLSYPVPDKGRYAYAWVECEPIPPPTETATLVQRNDETFFAYLYFPCPEPTPYVVDVQKVTGDLDGDFSTTADQFAPEYVVDAGLQVRPGPVAPGVYVQVVMTCSSVQRTL